jgi:hypothetical protein
MGSYIDISCVACGLSGTRPLGDHGKRTVVDFMKGPNENIGFFCICVWFCFLSYLFPNKHVDSKIDDLTEMTICA